MADYISWIRSKVGRRKIFVVYSSVVVEDEYGRILLQRRRDFDVWGLPGGVLEVDEDILTCAHREVQEETGLLLGNVRLTGIYTDPRYDVVYPNGDAVQQFTFCFAGGVTGGTLRPDPVECTGASFFTLAETAVLPMPHWYKAMITDYARCSETAFLPPFALPETADQIAQVRPYIGKARLIGTGAMAVVQRDDGRILMIRRRDNGTWIFPSGFCDLGENAAYTAVRETWEETGLVITPTRIIGIYSHPTFHHTYANGDPVKNVGVVFAARWTDGQLQPNTQEVSETAWVWPAQAIQKTDPVFAPFMANFIQALEGGPPVIW
ncbi:MAG: NUDIX domain-containing protein [Candidatus Promineifilaceae bacterium]